MMCDEVVEWLLEAESEDIRRALDASLQSETPAGAWQDHVARCGDCAKLAERILEQERAIGGALLETSSPVPFPVAWAKAETEARSRTVRRRRLRSTWIVSAAAAAVVGMLLLGSEDEGRRLPHAAEEASSPASSPMQPVSLPALLSSETGSVAVMQTSDPDVVVFWFFGAES